MYTIRRAVPADAAWCGYVNVVSWRHTYAGMVDDDILKRLDVVPRVERWAQAITDPSQAVFVAADEQGRVVGYVNGGKERSGDPEHTGELYAIYLLPEVQRQGVGRRLFRAIADWLGSQGHRSMLLWVLKDNTPSVRFYESMGGRPVREQTITIGGELLEVAYVYDLHQVLQK